MTMITPGFVLDVKNNKRGGVIVYTIKNEELFFLLGIDRKTREYTDFGGGCKQGETLSTVLGESSEKRLAGSSTDCQRSTSSTLVQ